MKFKHLLAAGVSAAMLLFVSPAGAATIHECVNAKPTAASYTWDFQQEADAIFQAVQSDAQDVSDHAAKLQGFVIDTDVSWQTHGDQLRQMKAKMNDLGMRLCRLQTIRRVLTPWQQKMVDQIGTNVQLMADNAQDAITFVDSNHDALWKPTYDRHVNNIYDESTQLARNTSNAVTYAKIQKEYRELRGKLGIG